MKALGAIKLFTLSFLILGFGNGLAQEYDDLYFNSSDRKKDKVENTVVAKNTTVFTPQSPALSTQTYGDETVNYSAKHVNPEYIARYKSAPADESAIVNEDSEDSYYVEDYDQVTEYPDEKKYKHSNYYPYPSTFQGSRDPWLARNYYGRSYYDPFWGMNSSPGWNMGLGYTFGSMSGWNMSMGYGSGGWGYNPYNYYGSPYGSMYDPWSSYSMYDPWYSGSYYSSYSYYNPCRNPYRYAYSNSYNRYYGGYYGGGSVFYPMNSGYDHRNVKLAKRTARGSNTKPGTSNIDRERHYSQDARTNENSRAKVASTEKRDHSEIQNEYYGRSRNNAYSGTRTRSSSNRDLTTTSSNRSSVGTSSTTRTRATREKSNYSRPSYKNNQNQNRSNSYNRLTNYNSGSNSRSYRSSGYQRSSNSSSRSYSSSGSYSSGSKSSSSSGSRSFSSGSSGSRSSSSSSSGRSSSSRGRR
ncbi:hypothetical protein ACFLU5_00680 [Bacteroidota bacterium]